MKPIKHSETNPEQKRIVPVIHEHSKHLFTGSDIIEPAEVNIADVSKLTGPLKPGLPVDLIAVSMFDEAISSGLMDPMDMLSPEVSLEKIYYYDAEQDLVKVFSAEEKSVTDKHKEGNTVLLINSMLTVSVNLDTSVVTSEDPAAGAPSHVVGYTLKAFRR